MRRRASGSGAEDDEGSTSVTNTAGKSMEKTRDFLNKPIDQVQEGRKDQGRRRSGDFGTGLGPSSKSATWIKPTATSRHSLDKAPLDQQLTDEQSSEIMAEYHRRQRARWRSPWSCSPLTLVSTAVSFLVLFIIVQSFLTRQLDPKGCSMSWMRAAYVKYSDFDTEHTRFASKYSLYLYREGGIDEDTRVKGIPVLFIPGNAGSYKQVRPIAAEAAYYFHDVLQHDPDALQAGKRALDFFAVDFNEDITAFHGQTLLDQAEYLNEAVAYILALYHNPNRSVRDPSLPDPTSVIIVGHSMGGIVARTMLTMPNYQANTINTIITLSAPHARAPVSFDADMVNTYKSINDYWRRSYASGEDNPLAHLTLISVAGGGLDTVVPSDYSSLSSLVPESHGFTVFTSTIPRVWTGMDHLAIMWCDQFRKALVRALYDVADVNRPSQTVTRSERMRLFRRRFLTGLEPSVKRELGDQEPKMLLTLQDKSTAILPHGERLVLRSLGAVGKSEAHVLPIPIQAPAEGRRFTLLTDQNLKVDSNIEVFFCSVYTHQTGQIGHLFSMNMDLSGEAAGSTRLACKSAAADVAEIPASKPDSLYAFDASAPFSYLEYDLADLADYQFVAVIDKASEPIDGWVIGEFSPSSESTMRIQKKLQRVLTKGLHRRLPPSRPMVSHIHIPNVHSSLLAYQLSIRQECSAPELFKPMLRQYIHEPYESKFYPNVKDVNVNLHGISPYVPPPSTAMHTNDGLSLQIWSDPACNGTMDVRLNVDMLGSAGKLVMRYRTVFAAFPLVVVALVLRKQFKIYNTTGIFMSFTEAMDQCIRTTLPVLFIALSFLALSLAKTPGSLGADLLGKPSNKTESVGDFTKNELLLGSQDPFFWFLVPLFGFLSVGVCIAFNYATLALTQLFAFIYSAIRSVSLRADDGRRTATAFAITSPQQRIITTSILLLLVITIIPYQFAYIVLCIVQLATCVRALRLARETVSSILSIPALFSFLLTLTFT